VVTGRRAILSRDRAAAMEFRNFSPPETERETEDYAVELSDVTALELNMVPDKSGGEARASLECLRLG
jgi:hypothetical protein